MISFAFHRANGQGLVNCEIATAALARGHRVTLFCEDADPVLAATRASTWSNSPAASCRPSCSAIRRWRSRRPWPSPSAGRDLDIIATNGFCMWGRSDVNAVHFLHRTWAESPNHPWRLKKTADSAYRWLYSLANCRFERHSFERSRHIVAVSEPLRQEVIGLGLPADRVSTIYNGVDLARFRPGPPERDRFGLPEGVPMGIFVGDIQTSRKNLDSVLKALVDVPGVHLAIVGTAGGQHVPGHGGAAGRRRPLPLHRVHDPDDVAAAFRSTDFFIFPSRYETSGLVLLEAAATGLPLITARSVGGAGIFAPDAALIADRPGRCSLADESDAPVARRSATCGRSLPCRAGDCGAPDVGGGDGSATSTFSSGLPTATLR